MKNVLMVAGWVFGFTALAQERPLSLKMDFEEYDPPSSLVVKEHRLKRARYPFIDIHNHQFDMSPGPAQRTRGKNGSIEYGRDD